MKLRHAAFAGSYGAGLLRVVARPRFRPTRYCVLAYHGVSNTPQPLFTSAWLFEQHLHFFNQWGAVATMDEVAAFLSGQPVPAGPALRFVITFDDGYANVIRNAVPLLRLYRAQGIVYVNPGWIDRGVIPWWFQLAGPDTRAQSLRRALAEKGFGGYPGVDAAGADLWPMQMIKAISGRIPQESFESWWSDFTANFPALADPDCPEAKLAGWPELASARGVLDIGSHTLSHTVLGLCRDEAFALSQLQVAKTAIETQTQQPCVHFAYPRGGLGDFGPLTRSWLVNCGHKTAVTTLHGCVRKSADAFAIPRFYIGETPVAELAADIAGMAARWDAGIHTVRKAFGRVE